MEINQIEPNQQVPGTVDTQKQSWWKSKNALIVYVLIILLLLIGFGYTFYDKNQGEEMTPSEETATEQSTSTTPGGTTPSPVPGQEEPSQSPTGTVVRVCEGEWCTYKFNNFSVPYYRDWIADESAIPAIKVLTLGPSKEDSGYVTPIIRIAPLDIPGYTSLTDVERTELIEVDVDRMENLVFDNPELDVFAYQATSPFTPQTYYYLVFTPRGGLKIQTYYETNDVSTISEASTVKEAAMVKEILRGIKLAE